MILALDALIDASLADPSTAATPAGAEPACRVCGRSLDHAAEPEIIYRGFWLCIECIRDVVSAEDNRR
jgi:hypothetical protein